LRAAAGAAFLFVDKDWPDYNAWVQSSGAFGQQFIVFENSSVVIVATGA